MSIVTPKKNHYQVIIEVDSNTSLSYGIASIEDPYISVPNISPNLDFITDLVQKINKGNLSTLHLLDVIEDSLP